MLKSKSMGNGFIIAGAVLITIASALVLYNEVDNYKCKKAANGVLTEVSAYVDYEAAINDILDEENENQTTVIPPESLLPEEYVESTFVIQGVEYIGVVSIPALDITLPVTSEWDMKKMKSAACRYSGSKGNDDLIICAHNLKAFFSGIKSLSTDDIIIFVDGAGKAYSYKVIQIDTISAYDTEKMLSGSDEWDITLFTCTYGGSDRYAVRAVKIQN